MPNAPLCNVVVLNDDATPMEFVVHVLQDVFDLNFEEARLLMLGIHHNGKAICGTYPREEAEARAADVLAKARARNHPLKCIVEEQLHW